MDKRQDFTGINPDIRLDQIQIDSASTREALHKLMVSYALGTNPNFIISGCVVVIGGAAPSNTWSLAEGYIFLNGEVIQVDSQSGSFDSGTEFLAFSKQITYDSKGDIIYKNGTPRQTWQVNRGLITVKGSVLVTELDAIDGDHLDDKLKAYIGEPTTMIKGVVEKATTTEAQTGVSDKYIDAALLQLVTASTSRKGIVEKSTSAEARAGTAEKYIDARLLEIVNTPIALTPVVVNSNVGNTQNSNSLKYMRSGVNIRIIGYIDLDVSPSVSVYDIDISSILNGGITSNGVDGIGTFIASGGSYPSGVLAVKYKNSTEISVLALPGSIGGSNTELYINAHVVDS